MAAGWGFFPTGAILASGAFFMVVNFRKYGLRRGWLTGAATTFILAELTVSMIVIPAFNPLKTPVALARDAQAMLAPSQRRLLYDMNEEIMALYSHLKGKQVNIPDALETEMRAARKGIVVFSKHNWEILKDRFQSMGTLREFRHGSKDICYLIYEVDAVHGR